MLPFHGGGRYDSSGILLRSIGVKKAKMGSGDKDPAYILAQNTCLKIVVFSLLFVFLVVVVLATTIYKVELRSRVAEEATEAEKILSRVEERNIHHRLVEAHLVLEDALKAQNEDFNDFGGYYVTLKKKLKGLKAKYKENCIESVDHFEKVIVRMSERLLDEFSKRSRKAQQVLGDMKRAVRAEVARDEKQEDQYHSFFLKEKKKTHKQLARMENTANQDLSSPTKLKTVVENTFQWYRSEFDEKNFGGKFHGVNITQSLILEWKEFLHKVESSMLEAAVGGSPAQRDLRPLQRQLQRIMDLNNWEFSPTGGLKATANAFKDMIQTGAVFLNRKRIGKIEKRYQISSDVYEAMDGIERLMVDGIIPKDVVNRIYQELSDHGSKCTYFGPHFGMRLEGKPEIPERFQSLEEAKKACNKLDDCGGITQMTAEGDRDSHYVLRTGSKLHRSHGGERSWVKDCSGRVNSEEDIIRGQAEAISMF